MNPYYQDASVSIYHADCRDVDPIAVDAIVTDPPYGETALEWDRPCIDWQKRAALWTRSLWCFGSLSFFMDSAGAGEWSHWRRSQELVWEKHNGSSFHADRFKRVHELVAHFYSGEWSTLYKSPVFTADAHILAPSAGEAVRRIWVTLVRHSTAPPTVARG